MTARVPRQRDNGHAVTNTADGKVKLETSSGRPHRLERNGNGTAVTSHTDTPRTDRQ